MTTLTLIAVRLADEVLAASAHDRWQGVKHLKGSNIDFISSVWFKVAMVVLFTGVAIAITAVSLYNRFSQRKIAERAFAQGVSRKQLTPSETSILIAITSRIGLERMADIFLMGDAFERGADMLIKESLIGGKPTNETAHLKKQLVSLKEKMNFRKVAGGAYYSNGSDGQSADGGFAGPMAGKKVFVALFPLVGKADSINGDDTENPKQGDSPPEFKISPSEFLPAIVTGLVGRVLFIETTLSANVGDRIIVVINSDIDSGYSGAPESIENIGIIEQSVEPAETLKMPNAHRLSVSFAELSESQMTQLAKAVNGESGRDVIEQVLTGDSSEGANAEAALRPRRTS
jgi:hypothetical protein